MNVLVQPLAGRVWKLGDAVDTNQLAGGGLTGETAEQTLRLNCLRVLRPDFPDGVRSGDLIVGGHNFGCGSSRQTAVEALALSGIAAVLVESVARIFRRNCVAFGLPLLVAPGVGEVVNEGDEILIDYPARRLTVTATGATCDLAPWSEGVEEIYAEGGLGAVIAARLSAAGFPPDATP